MAKWLWAPQGRVTKHEGCVLSQGGSCMYVCAGALLGLP